MDDGTSTLITVITLDYFTYHTHLTDSLFGGNNYTVRYHELAGSEGNTVVTSLWRVQRRNQSIVLFGKGRSGS